MADNDMFMPVGWDYLLITLSEGGVLYSFTKSAPSVQYSIRGSDECVWCGCYDFLFPRGLACRQNICSKTNNSSMLSTGIAGLYFATFPSYRLAIAIHAFWGVSVTLTFWAALIKATRNWAPPTQQGRAFGILESGRGIAEVVSSAALLAIFAKLGSENFALSRVIILFSLLDIIIGLIVWFTLEDSSKDKSETEEDKEKIGL